MDGNTSPAGSFARGERSGSTRGLLALGAQALWRDGDVRRSRRLFESAYRRAQADTDPRADAAAALGAAGLWAGEHESSAAAGVVLERLRRAVPAAEAVGDGRLSLRLQARLAAEADQRSGGHSAIIAALEHARRLGDPVVLAETSNLACQCLLSPACGDLRRDVADELLTASLRTRRPGDRLLAGLWRTVRLVLDGSAEAPRSLGDLRALLAMQRNLTVEHCAQAIEVLYEVRAGRFERAEVLAQRCAAAGAAAGRSAAAAWRAAHLVAVRWYQGRIGESLRELRLIDADSSPNPADYSRQAWLAVAYAAAGQERHARAALAGLTGDGRSLSELPRSGTWLVTMYATVEAAHVLGDRETAEEAHRLLLPYAGLPAVAGPAVSCFGSVDHSLGMARLTLSDRDAAAQHLRRAVVYNTELGHLPAAALSRRCLAGMAETR